MNDQIRAYIDRAFADIPQTRKVVELKEELVGNLTEKFSDELGRGLTEEEAYNSAISGIGDISELVESMRGPQPLSPPSPRDRSRRALLVAAAIVLYIMSPFVAMLGMAYLRNAILGAFAMFLCIALGTGLLIFNHLSLPRYQPADTSMVEDFKAYRVNSFNRRAAYRSLLGAYWCIVLVVYLSISFLWRNWGYSWVLFLVALAGMFILLDVLDKCLGRRLFWSYWCLVLAVYFLVSFWLNAWPYSWLLFLAAAAVQGIVTGVAGLRREKE